jgi:hypothetical protein
MAKIAPPPKSRKGTPPSLANTVGNLDKPEPQGLDTLNLRVPFEFKRELKILAAHRGTSMTDLIIEGIGLLRAQHGTIQN